MANSPLTQHPEAPDNEGWMHVAIRQQAPPPPPPAPLLPGGMLIPYLAILGAGLVLGGLLASGVNDLRARNAENRATQATQELQAKQQAIDTFCRGVAK